MQFYIMHQGKESGPYDLAGLVRKVKNGSLKADTLVRAETSQTHIPAMQHKDLKNFFAQAHESALEEEPASARNYYLGKMLRDGWRFATKNSAALKASGFMLIASAITSSIFWKAGPLGWWLAFIVSYIFYAILLSYSLRLCRGQPVDFADIRANATANLKKLALAGGLVAVPLLLFVFNPLFLVIGVFSLSIYAFTPWLILEKKLGSWEAMETSRKLVMQLGMDNFAVIFALMAINMIAGALLLLPLLVTLPMSIHALAEIYDDHLEKVTF